MKRTVMEEISEMLKGKKIVSIEYDIDSVRVIAEDEITKQYFTLELEFNVDWAYEERTVETTLTEAQVTHKVLQQGLLG